jgi:hypothetical protein
MAARFGALVAATGTGVVALTLPMSAAARSFGGSIIGEALNWVTLAGALLGWADLVWHDIRGRLLLPSLDPHFRHHVCVLLYHGLAAAWGLRAMVLFGSDTGQPIERFILGSWYLWTAIGVGILAVVMAVDER